MLFAFIFYGQSSGISWFFTCLLILIITRILITKSYRSNHKDNYKKFITNYVIASLLLGMTLGLLSLFYYDLSINELRLFLTIVNLSLIVAAIGTLSAWMPAYIGFSVPQLISVFLVYILNENYFVTVSVIVFSWFMIKIALNFNQRFKQSLLLIDENLSLVDKMNQEIEMRKSVQQQLESNQVELEHLVQKKSSELKESHFSLKDEIDKRTIVEEKLEYIAYYDELTGLPNRRLLIENLKNSLARAKRNKSLLGVLFIDLDRFKNINESHGHHIGDKLIQSVAERLRLILRDSDTIARNSGDEFVVFMENMMDVNEAFIVSKKIISEINKQFMLDEHEVHISASIGISLFPLDGDDALELLKLSDTAMHASKNEGRNNFQFYSNSMSVQVKNRLNIENALRMALSNNEFYVVYQPQVNILTQQTSGFEALLRWDNPELGLVSPIEFIPVLEETGLIYDVGEWVILEVMKFIKSGLPNDTKISINLSALQCGVSDYSKHIKNLINAANVDPALIEFEITETLLINDFRQTEMFLTDIHDLGCTIALDDFGIGYTSFTYITKLPIDIIKIDRSLITGIENNKNLQDVVRAIVTMSNSLGIENVFEGVETSEELAMVDSLHGKIIQGYLFSKPLKQADVALWLGAAVQNKYKKK